MNIISSILLSRGELMNHVLQMEKPVLRQSGAWLVCLSMGTQCYLKLLGESGTSCTGDPCALAQTWSWTSRGISKDTDNQF